MAASSSKGHLVSSPRPRKNRRPDQMLNPPHLQINWITDPSPAKIESGDAI